MNEQLIKRVIADQAEELKIRKNIKLVERDVFSYAKQFLNEKIIKVITGVRRCGKSTFCHQLLEGQSYGYLNFDDERLMGLEANDLDQILENILVAYPNAQYLLFDEIQNVYGWELFANRLMRQGYNIVLSGSNSKMLSRELATHLTGRSIQIELFPFSFREYLKLKNENYDENQSNSTKKIAKIRLLLNEYIEYGGFPEINILENKNKYLRELFDKIIFRDIVERYKIRDITTLKELGLTMINYFSYLFTYNKLSNSLQINSVNTVKEYLSYLEETYLICYLQNHSFKIKEEIRNPRKVYSIDTGLINALSTSISQNYGRKIENIVFLNEKRKENRINYFSDGKCEVDFLITNQKNEITLIQVAQDISDERTFKREIDSILKTVKNISAKKLLIINETKEEKFNIDGNQIEIIPLWKYLLT
ncbi:MAG TPA: ATP-binding protein [Candidatus Kapabacteria bacterium]|nr:ATP-binding protein [Candidatus Kapabacteria bacterium]